MADCRGCLRSESLLRSRVAHYVRYPGLKLAYRIVTVKASEYAIGMACLRLCREHPSEDKNVLQAACSRLRAALPSRLFR
jgi:hypothetical protein